MTAEAGQLALCTGTAPKCCFVNLPAMRLAQAAFYCLQVAWGRPAVDFSNMYNIFWKKSAQVILNVYKTSPENQYCTMFGTRRPTIAGVQCSYDSHAMLFPMQGFADVPVIHFDTMSGAFGGHAHFGDASR